MRIFTRQEIRQLINDLQKEYQGMSGEKLTLQDFCKMNRLYYSGVVRFLKGGECSVHTYFKILNAADQTLPETNHYLSHKLMYSDLSDLGSFLKQIQYK